MLLARTTEPKLAALSTVLNEYREDTVSDGYDAMQRSYGELAMPSSLSRCSSSPKALRDTSSGRRGGANVAAKQAAPFRSTIAKSLDLSVGI